VSDEFLDKIFACKNTDTLTLNLEKQTLTIEATGESTSFDINSYKKECMINGFDDIDYLLSLKKEIATFEKTLAV
jgi:3-isopropylmalate/(R)-2-methylmalate dehydratase small subunit